MRKIIYRVTTSADGFIARPDGAVDWLDRPRPKHMYGMKEFVESIDTVLWGRKTYDMALKFGKKDLWPGKKNYVFSRQTQISRYAEFVGDDIHAFARAQRRQKGKGIWIMGGAELAGSFLGAGELDIISIAIVPILIGEGMPLLAPSRRQIPLRLASSKSYPDGVVQVNYSVGKHKAQRSR